MQHFVLLILSNAFDDGCLLRQLLFVVSASLSINIASISAHDVTCRLAHLSFCVCVSVGRLVGWSTSGSNQPFCHNALSGPTDRQTGRSVGRLVGLSVSPESALWQNS